MSSTAIRRINADIRELRMEKNPMIHAAPLSDNMFEWHFTIHGTPNSDYEGGVYHGRILLPPEWPMKPPQIIFCTLNGRFEVNTPVCLSFTSFHPEEWNPSWGIRTILEAVISFFPVESEGSVGSICCSSELRKRFAKESRKFVCPNCGPIVDLIPPLTKEHIQMYYTSTPAEEPKEEEKEEEKEEPQQPEVEVVTEEDVKLPEGTEEPVSVEDEANLSIKDVLKGFRYSHPTDEAVLQETITKNPSVIKPSPLVPPIFPKEMMEGMQSRAAYLEALRQRRGGEQVSPSFIPIYVPVIVPVHMDEKKENTENKLTCSKVLSVCISLVCIVIYGIILYYQFLQ